MTTLVTRSEAETMEAGRQLVAALGAGSIVLLHGPLGAGKTAFVRGLALGLGIAEDDVSSPTFTLVHEYRGGRLPLLHADLYRLPEGTALEDLGLDEIAADGILAVEWPERLAHPLAAAVHVRIDVGEGETRTLTITP